MGPFWIALRDYVLELLVLTPDKFTSCRLGRVERARKIIKSSGQHIEIGDIQKLDKIEKHLMNCLAAKRASDWISVIRESEGAIAAGADSSPQVKATPRRTFCKMF